MEQTKKNIEQIDSQNSEQSSEKKKISAKKVFQVLLNVLLYLFLALCVLTLLFTLVSRTRSDGAAELFGYQMMVVASDSMAECEFTDVSQYEIKSIPVRSMVFVETVPDDPEEAERWYSNLKVGDVLTFRYVYTTQETITHRIVGFTAKPSGGYIITLAGDNKNAEGGQMQQTIDTSLSETSANYVIGKVVATNYLFGFVVSLLKQPIALVLIVIVPCLIIMIMEIIRIVTFLSNEKKQKQQEEIDELKRQLAEMHLIADGGEHPADEKQSAALPEPEEMTETDKMPESEKTPEAVSTVEDAKTRLEALQRQLEALQSQIAATRQASEQTQESSADGECETRISETSEAESDTPVTEVLGEMKEEKEKES